MAGKKPTAVKPASSSAPTSSPKHRPKQVSKASAAGVKVRSPAKPPKNSKEKPTPVKKARDKPEPEAGAKRKKQQASGEAGTPKKKGKKRDEQESTPRKEAKSTKKQQSSGKKQQKGGTGKSTPTKRKREDAEPQKEVRSPKKESGEREPGAPTPVKKQQKDKKGVVADMGTCSFPMARVRQLMRAEDDTIRSSSEAVFLINKASELFLEKFADDAYCNALKDRKKSIIYDNLSTSVCNQKGFKFLSDCVPQRLRAEDALKAAAASPP